MSEEKKEVPVVMLSGKDFDEKMKFLMGNAQRTIELSKQAHDYFSQIKKDIEMAYQVGTINQTVFTNMAFLMFTYFTAHQAVADFLEDFASQSLSSYNPYDLLIERIAEQRETLDADKEPSGLDESIKQNI